MKKVAVRRKFPKELHAKLGNYFFRLIDPRNGSTFYVERGIRDRVFDHIYDEKFSVSEADALSLKLSTIRQIRMEGLIPVHVIHRHELKEDEARLAEAVLIDAFPGLTNEVLGYKSAEFGPANSEQLVNRYSATEMEFSSSDRVVAINVARSVEERSVYKSVRFAWRMSLVRAKKANLVLAMTQGTCCGVYLPESWHPAGPEHFPDLTDDVIPNRTGFIGKSADDNVAGRFLGKRLPAAMQWVPGKASPILYNYS